MAGPTKMGWAPGAILRRLYREAAAGIMRTGAIRASENPSSRHSGEAFSTVPHPLKPGHIGQTVNARGFAYASCYALQPLVVRQFKGRTFRIVYC
jgi:hypothetical protein